MFDNIYCSNRCTALLIMIHDEMVPISIWPWEPSLHAPFWHTARHQEDSRCGARAQTVPRNQLPNWDDSCRIANNNKNNQNVEGRLRGRIKTAFFFPPPASFKDGNMTQTGLTFRLQLTVTAPGMDQNERGMSWWKPGSGQRCNNHTLLFHLCQITVHALARSLWNDRPWQTVPSGMAGRERRRTKPPTPPALKTTTQRWQISGKPQTTQQVSRVFSYWRLGGEWGPTVSLTHL